jgi:hypothetical protein
MSAYEPRGVVEPPLKQAAPRATNGSQHRWDSGARLLGDDRLRWLEILLDEAFVVPGTQVRFGIDGIVGLIPGLGDVLAGILSLIIPLAAWVRGVPYITLIRMLTNVSIGLLAGTIPILGDAFDIFWKANRRNYALLTRSIAEPRRHTWRDWAFLLLLGCMIALIFTLPIALTVWLIAKLAMWHPGN